MSDTRDFVQPSDFNRQSTEDQPAKQSETIPVIEEQLRVGKEVVEAGRVRFAKSVSEHEEAIRMPVVHEEVIVERITVNQYVETPPPPVRYEGRTMIIPVLQEVVVVEKRLMLVEELRVTKREVHSHDTQHVTLRKEEIKVEHVSDTSNPK